MYEFLCEIEITNSLVTVGGDSTNVNTEWKGGAIHFLELKINKKLIWLICALHAKELSLRHLMINLNGKIITYNKFGGPIGKLVNDVDNMKWKDSIPPLDVQVNLIPLDEDFVEDLSGDQKYLYMITNAILKGITPPELRFKKIGPHSHARWLNVAIRHCRMWCYENYLGESSLRNLKLIMKFVVGVYSPM